MTNCTILTCVVGMRYVHPYVTDVNAYPRIMNDLLNANNSRDLMRRHLCPLLGLWHIGKQMGCLIFKKFFPTVMGPLLLTLSPNTPARTFSSFSLIGQLLTSINLAYDEARPKLIEAVTANNHREVLRDHAQNTFDLVDKFIPIFIDFMISVKLNDWDTTKVLLKQALVVLLAFSSDLYTSGVGTFVWHLQYLEDCNHPIMNMIRGDLQRLNEECVEIANSWLSKGTGDDSRRSDLVLMNREYIMQK